MGVRFVKVSRPGMVTLSVSTSKAVDKWRGDKLTRAAAVEFICEHYFNEGWAAARELKSLQKKVHGLKWT